jgi:phosphatidate cytidylyltransferase
MHSVFLLTSSYFLIGGIATWRVNINRRSSEIESRERWKKLAFYFLIVHVVILAILSGGWYFTLLAGALVGLGLGELLRAVARRPGRPSAALRAALLLYLACGFTFIQFARLSSTEMILFVYVIVLTFDGFSQIAGQLFGRHKLAPQVSPGKTVEGLLGGLVMAAVSALPLSGWTGIGRGPAIALSLLIAASALLGDLAASAVKRACQVKDYGTSIPGHGGVLDRFDSFIAAGGLFWAFVL